MEQFDKTIDGWVVVWWKILKGRLKLTGKKAHVDCAFYTTRHAALLRACALERMFPNRACRVCPASVRV